MGLRLIFLAIFWQLSCTPATRVPVAKDDDGSVGLGNNLGEFAGFAETAPDAASSSEVNADGISLVSEVNIGWPSYPDTLNLSNYNIRIGSTEGESDILAVTDVNKIETYTFTGEDGGTYYFSVQAVSLSEVSSPWADPFVFTIDLSPPQSASNLQNLADGPTDTSFSQDDDLEFYFSWTAGTDIPGSGVTNYQVNWYTTADCSGSSITVPNVTETYLAHSGNLNDTYTFTVTTIDRAKRQTASNCSPPITLVTAVIPTVDNVGALSKTALSAVGANTSSDFSVTCSDNGYVGVLDNADDDIIINWTPVLASTPQNLTIQSSALQAVTTTDGLVTLKVICRSYTSTFSSPDTSRSISIDSTPPLPLDGLSIATGTVTDGDVNITIDYPTNTSDYDHIDIRRISGTTAPDEDCSSDGSVAMTINAPFNDGMTTDATGSAIGDEFSYRLCIYDTAGNFNNADFQNGIQARDTVIPPALTSFSGGTSSSVDGEIDLTWSYPADKSDYDVLTIRRLLGGTAPNLDCTSDGSEILNISSPFVQTSYVDDTMSTIGEDFSYRVCIYDTSNNLRATNVATGVRARDTSYPNALDGLSGVPGVSSGYVDITVDYPADSSDYDTFTIRRLAGSTAPNSDCTSDGSQVYINSTGPYNDFTYQDNTSSTTGAAFSYRVCIWDLSLNLTSSNTLVNINAEDLAAPPALTAFAAATGTLAGRINLTVNFPVDVTDYNQVVIRRKAGATPPSSACNTDSAVKTYSVGQFNDELPLVDSGLTPGANYSYRVCIYDASSNLTNSQTASNVMAYLGTWYNVDKSNCATYCSGISKTSVASPEGSKCASGENRPQSAIDKPVTFTYGCFGSCSSPFTYSAADTYSGNNQYCYGSGQTVDYDTSDFTIACYCQ